MAECEASRSLCDSDWYAYSLWRGGSPLLVFLGGDTVDFEPRTDPFPCIERVRITSRFYVLYFFLKNITVVPNGDQMNVHYPRPFAAS